MRTLNSYQIVGDKSLHRRASGALSGIGTGGDADVGQTGLGFRPSSGFPTFGLKAVGGEPLRLTHGKWYYEVTIGNAQLKYPQFGWCDERFAPNSGTGVGDDAFSWAIDGHRVMKWHDGDGEEWGEKWTAGDVLGCMADLDAKTLSFSLNGANMGVACAVRVDVQVVVGVGNL